LSDKDNKTIIINAVGDIMLAGKVGEKMVHEGAGHLLKKIRPKCKQFLEIK